MHTSLKANRVVLIAALLGLGIVGCDSHNAPTTGSGGQSSGASAPSAPPVSSAQTGPAPASPMAGASNMANAGPSAAMDDAAITGKIKAELARDEALKGANIVVITEKGAVALTGSVDSQAQVNHAADLARGVDGVQSVDNRLIAKGTG